jgi:predicted NUDIX family phosphoesterase
MAPDPEKQRIQILEKRAKELKILLEARTAKRPLIIEFSGAPKAGKTRCISVLELFFKRNGIKAEVFTERASIAPIRQKGHLNFNIWVSCASLQGMLEALYRDLDVFILDRGIFDALVWNEWLEMTGKITPSEASQVAQFFAMDRWTRMVDVVFLLTCDPKVSIDREFSDQLTTKRGTIMSEGTLGQLNELAKKTTRKYKSKFGEIVAMDTTHSETRQTVTRIAEKSLEVLAQFLDESICVLPSDALTVRLPEKGFVSNPRAISEFVETVQRAKVFTPRTLAEKNANQLQPIPCAVLRYADKVLILRRNKPGHPLHDKYDVWAGGHVSEADNGPNILLQTLKRELNEEVFIKDSIRINSKPIGLVRTNEDARASRHIAVLYEIHLKNENVALALSQREFRSTRGTSLSGRLVPIKELGEIYGKMGDWSKSIVDHFWPGSGGKKGNREVPLFADT